MRAGGLSGKLPAETAAAPLCLLLPACTAALTTCLDVLSTCCLAVHVLPAGGVTFDDDTVALGEDGLPESLLWSGLAPQSKLAKADDQGLWVKCSNATDMSPLSTISGARAAVFAGTNADSTNATASIASPDAASTVLVLKGLFAVSVKVRIPGAGERWQ